MDVLRLRAFIARCLRQALIILISAFALAPFLWMLSLSFKSPDEIFGSAAPRSQQTAFHHVDNYRIALTRVPLAHYMLNGLFVCSAVLLLQIVIAVPCAYALAKLRFSFDRFLFRLVLVGLLIPPVAIAVPLFLLVTRFHLFDNYAALIFPSIVSPFGIFLFRQHFKMVADDLIHAARLDGVSEAGIIWHIMLPLAKPALAAFGILSVVSRWNDLFWPMIMTYSNSLAPPALGVVYFHNEESGYDYGPLMAGAVLIVAPLIVAFIISTKRFIEGITLGAKQ